MAFVITAPGIYLDVPTDAYFCDPCPAPSLTQSVAKTLLDRSPKHAWLQHPRLNSSYERHEPTKFDIGNVAHSLMLGRGKNVVTVDADDWRTKAVKEAREEAALDGKLAVLGKHHEQAQAMVLSARLQMSAMPDLGGAFTDGHGEVVIAAKVSGIWMRSMVDWMTSPRVLYDYKTTGLSASPERIPYIMADAGWDFQAAFQERIFDAIDPDGVGRRKFIFVLQEADDPYAVVPAEITESVMNLGRRKVDAAITIWRSCMVTGEWPMYGTKIQQPSYPAYAEARWMEKLMMEQGEVE